MSFLFFIIIPMLLVGWAQMRVRSAFKKYSRVPATAGISGAETARRILKEQGIYDVAVEETGGALSDHYDPRSKVVHLSSENFHGHSLAGILFFAGAVLFQLVTLPVEFNASSRAMAILAQGYIAGDEVRPAKKVLNAAAMTYVAATATAVMQLVHLLLLRGSDD